MSSDPGRDFHHKNNLGKANDHPSQKQDQRNPRKTTPDQICNSSGGRNNLGDSNVLSDPEIEYGEDCRDSLRMKNRNLQKSLKKKFKINPSPHNNPNSAVFMQRGSADEIMHNLPGTSLANLKRLDVFTPAKVGQGTPRF